MKRFTKRLDKIMNYAFKIIIPMMIVFLICSFLFYTTYSVVSYFHKETFTGTITDKYTKRNNSEDDFFIVLDDKKVIMNTDITMKARFNSADVQAELNKGDKVRVKTIGYRIPMLDTFPKMYEVKILKE